MKKFLALLMTLVLLLSCFAGCDAQSEDREPNDRNPIDSNPQDETPETPQYPVISILEALELCGEEGNVTVGRYYIRGTVESITNPQYGAMVITDGTHSISVYNTAGYAEMDDKPYKGDEVLLHCILQNHKGSKEVKEAILIEFKHAEISVDEKDYTSMSIADARKAAEGTKVKVQGVVAQLTYANGMIPSGVVLVDNTDSIYIYDRNIAGRVKVGNELTVLASKTWWILADEASNAQKFGYKGCCQLESATLVAVSDTQSEFDKSWIQNSTVKEIMDNPMSKDITSRIFKVNALVTKAPGSGFTNYYFNDLDGTTGSYTYTQCNGSDFAWLDQFDGKICTVYLMAINAKASNAGCVYRFLPIAVYDEGFTFDKAAAAEFAVKYYGVTQFLSIYTGNPKLEVVTSVSSELLGFEDAELHYSSNNKSVVDFKMVGGKLIMNCLSAGTATVTVTGSYGSNTYEQTVQITVENNGQVQGSDVAEAISKNVGEEVVVSGIVGPSLVNKVGFYLIDDTGVIAVLTDSATMENIEIGQAVVLSGVRHLNTKDASYGQTCIKDAKIVSNSYGNHEYSTDSFITNKTLADFYALSVQTDYTTKVYVLKATVSVEETPYYTNINLTGGNVSVRLYCSSANQYNWLKVYAGQEVTVELAPCNWNSKNYYTGCVLAVRNADGSKTLNELNFTN